MSYRKFKPNDIILNTMKTYPSCELFIADATVYYNNIPEQTGEFSTTANIPTLPGHISLYEYNVDRKETSTGRSIGTASLEDKAVIYPWISKDSAGASFNTVSDTAYSNDWAYGDILTSSYPLTASITREYMTTAGARATGINVDTGETFKTTPTYPHYYALRNRFDYLGIRSKHYRITGSAVGSSYAWIKDQQDINLISIPSIFWGSKIQPSTLSLKWYLTGTLIGELQDTKQNGELIQIGPVGSEGSGSVAGVAFYNEGFIALTGSWDLNSEKIGLTSDAAKDNPKWVYFAAGANDGITTSNADSTLKSASFSLSFKGTTGIQVMTMWAQAQRGQANYSNNPTFLEHGQTLLSLTSSKIYEENPDRIIKNTVSSSYSDYSSSFKRQVYIGRVAIYDESKNLMGIATLSNPVLKEEDEDLTFKIRLDI